MGYLSSLGGLSPVQLYQLAKDAGFPSDTAVKMVAIAMKESGGNPNAHNSTPPDDSYGLWQINMLGSLGPARRAQFGISDNSQLFDPAANAHAAYMIWGGNDANLGRAWYIDRGVNQERYLANLPAAQAAASQVEGMMVANPEPVIDTISTSPDTIPTDGGVDGGDSTSPYSYSDLTVISSNPIPSSTLIISILLVGGLIVLLRRS